MAEILDLYDKDGNLTGETIERTQPIPEGKYCQIVHLCIFNKEKKLLSQRRALNKAGFGGYWDITVGGCVISGETVNEAMSREFKEELGLKFEFTDDQLFFVLRSDYSLDSFYFIKANVDLSIITMQKEEVMDVAYYSLEEVEQMMEKGTFIPYTYMNLLKQCRDMLFPEN